MSEKVEIQLQADGAAGVTDYAGNHHTADKHKVVSVDKYTANALAASKIASKTTRVFGGFTLPKKVVVENTITEE